MRAIKFIRNLMISIVILLVLFVGGGAAYTWYTDRHSYANTSAIATPVEATVAPTVKRVQPAPNAKESAAIEMITSPVAPGSNASITVETNPTSHCSIAVVYNQVASADSGLTTKAADESGVVSWTWTVDKTAPNGIWPVKVTCTHNKQSAFVQGDLVVAKQVN